MTSAARTARRAWPPPSSISTWAPPQEARVFAMRARELLKKDSVEWRRATDIVLTSNPSNQDLKDLAKEGAVTSGLRR
jgi:hypothetical protein